MTNIANRLPTSFTLARPENARGDNSLTQASFLRLMTTQLEAQDPFDPLDNQALVAQMAQFSSVAGIAEMNASLKALVSTLAQNRFGDASSWLGHNILVPGQWAAANNKGQYAGEFMLDADASNLSIDFLNDRGEIVHAIELGPRTAGVIAFQWDALNVDGKPDEHGLLKVRVNGGAISDLATWAIVEAVQSPLDSASARLMTARGDFLLSEAIRLS